MTTPPAVLVLDASAGSTVVVGVMVVPPVMVVSTWPFAVFVVMTVIPEITDGVRTGTSVVSSGISVV